MVVGEKDNRKRTATSVPFNTHTHTHTRTHTRMHARKQFPWLLCKETTNQFIDTVAQSHPNSCPHARPGDETFRNGFLMQSDIPHPAV
jgi:hypothetical protein